jgi:metal-responsive CopG/Arc/MetJ family transcriptional regulator
MRTVQMTLDNELVETVDRVAHALKTTRSAFTRMALQEALKKQSELRLVEKHREGYAKKPVRSGEFDDWEVEQAWGDE